MRQPRLPVMPRSFAVRPSRREVLRGLAGAGLGLAALRPLDAVLAKKKRKDKGKKPKLQRNEFGCVDVGGKCRGNGANCCSGICEGKKPKKGKKDTSVCLGHDNAGICFPDSDTCTFGQPVPCSAVDPGCLCVRTTGNAGFCGDFRRISTQCRDCAKDTDCLDEFGPGAACVVLDAACSLYCPGTGRRACFRPCPELAP